MTECGRIEFLQGANLRWKKAKGTNENFGASKCYQISEILPPNGQPGNPG